MCELRCICVHHDFSEQYRWRSCSCVTLLSGPLLTTLCLPMFCIQGLTLSNPHSSLLCLQFSRNHYQEPKVRRNKEDRQMCSHFSFRLGLWQLLGLLHRACSCQAASPLRFQFTLGIWILPSSLSLRFPAVLNSELPLSILLFFTLPAPLQLFPCIKFPFLDYLV